MHISVKKEFSAKCTAKMNSRRQRKCHEHCIVDKINTNDSLDLPPLAFPTCVARKKIRN